MCLPLFDFTRRNNSSKEYCHHPRKTLSLNAETPPIRKMSTVTSAKLPAPRLVVTTHTSEGSSVFASDSVVPQFHPFGPALSGFSNFHSSATVPVSNTEPLVDRATAPGVIPRCPPTGVNFGIADFPPNGRAPMHRTISADYGVILEGEIVMSLDSGEQKTLRKGEFLIQRGTNHEWINPSSELTCRILFIMVSAEKIVLNNGVVLEATVIGPKK
jgi:quercetin dioxygenase-like cupin family protein